MLVSTFLYNMLSYERMALVQVMHLASSHQGILSDLLKKYKRNVVLCADDRMSFSVKSILARNIIDGSESWKAKGLNAENQSD